MNEFVKSVYKALESGDCERALFTALILPDICSRAEHPEQTSMERWINWYNNYLANEYGRFLSAKDFYSLRCAYLYENKTDITNQRTKDKLRIILFMHDPSRSMHCNLFITTLQLNTYTFCEDICKNIKKWIINNATNDKVNLELSKIISEYSLLCYEEFDNKLKHSPKIFISYAHEDKSVAKQIAVDLKIAGFTAWIDEFEIEVGESITEKINLALSECDFFIVIISDNFIRKPYPMKELNSAIHKQASSKKPYIFPIRIDNVEIPNLISDILYADFYSNYSLGLSQLIKGLKKILNIRQS